MLDVAAINVAVLGEHLERRSVGCQLVVGIVEVGLTAFVQCTHGIDLAMHLVLHHREDFIQEASFVAGTLAQHKAYRALYVIALFDPSRFRLRADRPRGGRLQSGRPKDHAKVSPHRWILVREHHHLQPIVRHVPREVAIDVHH
ncbi:hypothetical protein D3C85_1043690 [compost metagenome]